MPTIFGFARPTAVSPVPSCGRVVSTGSKTPTLRSKFSVYVRGILFALCLLPRASRTMRVMILPIRCTLIMPASAAIMSTGKIMKVAWMRNALAVWMRLPTSGIGLSTTVTMKVAI